MAWLSCFSLGRENATLTHRCSLAHAQGECPPGSSRQEQGPGCCGASRYDLGTAVTATERADRRCLTDTQTAQLLPARWRPRCHLPLCGPESRDVFSSPTLTGQASSQPLIGHSEEPAYPLTLDPCPSRDVFAHGGKVPGKSPQVLSPTVLYSWLTFKSLLICKSLLLCKRGASPRAGVCLPAHGWRSKNPRVSPSSFLLAQTEPSGVYFSAPHVP